MVAATGSEQTHLDIETISEYIRESSSRGHDLPGNGSTMIVVQNEEKKAKPVFSAKPALSSPLMDNKEFSDTDVLETLWPGTHHHQDFLHTIKRRTPVFYLIAGFFCGAVIVSLIVWGIGLCSSFFTHPDKLSGSSPGGTTSNTEMSAAANGSKVLVPLVSTYEVQDGDTLAAIALRNYKHISPRLLDTICRANNLTDANVLNLGQKLTLPDYCPQQQ